MKIKCIHDCISEAYHIGKIYDVIEIDPGGYYKIKSDRSGGVPWWCHPNRFIVITNLNPKIKVI